MFLMDEFKKRIFVLASSAEIQSSLFPDFTCKGDEIVIDFGEAIECLNKSSFSIKSIRAIEALDNYIIANSGEEYKEHYLDNDLLDNSEIWANIRMLAMDALAELGWKYEIPKAGKYKYIGDDGT